MTKKVLAVVLLFAFVLTVFTGCSEEAEESEIILASDPVESYDNVSVFLPEGSGGEESTNSAAERPTGENGFVVKEKKYVYGENNVVLLNIENKTDKDYTLTVDGTYYAENGDVLKTETQTFEDYVAGYRGYFLFDPGMAFDSFGFTLSYEDFTGEARLSNVKALAWEFETASYQVWPEVLPGSSEEPENVLYTKWNMVNDNAITLHIKATVIAFDGKGEILCIRPSGYQKFPAGDVGGMDVDLYMTQEELTVDRSTWPENLQAGITLITVPMDAMTVEEFRAWEANVRG